MWQLVAAAKWIVGPNAFIMAGAIGVWLEGGILAMIMAHPIVFTACALYTLFAAVTAMRNPWDGWYNWFYRFSHAMVALAEQELNRMHPGLGQALEQEDQTPNPQPQPLPSSAVVSTEVRLGGSPLPSQT